ncbi:hypothetical protein TeGR_g6850, partial [Tetraparma gracilis]
VISHGLPEDRLEHFENDDSSSVDFLSFDCNIHALPKPLLDPYSVPDLKNPEELYFVYVCIKNPVKSKQKDDKKNRIFLQKEGKKALAKKMRDQRTKINKEGQFAKTPTRDAFGVERESDRRIKKTPEELLAEEEEKMRAENGGKEGEEGEGEAKEGDAKPPPPG